MANHWARPSAVGMEAGALAKPYGPNGAGGGKKKNSGSESPDSG